MSAKPISLAVHRNTVEKRRARTVKRDIMHAAKAIAGDNDIRGYALVAIDAQGRMHTAWDTGSIMPMWVFPEVMAAGLRRDLETTDVDETWQPPLPIKG